MRSYTKKIFNLLGFELRRLESTSKILRSPITKSLTIELMGPSGVGKSTLWSDARKVLHNKWNIKYPAVTEVRLDSNNQLDELYRCCLNNISLNLFERENSIERFERENSFERYGRLLTYFIQRAKEDRHLKLSGLLNIAGWFLDDGFCHNFKTEIIHAIEKHRIDNDTLKFFFEGRNFVFLNATDDWMLRNLRNRQKRTPGAGNDWLSVYGETSIIEYVRWELNQTRKLVEYSTQYGAFSYEINISDINNDALSSLIDIESKIIRNNRNYA